MVFKHIQPVNTEMFLVSFKMKAKTSTRSNRHNNYNYSSSKQQQQQQLRTRATRATRTTTKHDKNTFASFIIRIVSQTCFSKAVHRTEHQESIYLACKNSRLTLGGFQTPGRCEAAVFAGYLTVSNYL